jgi:hypothetical protein
MNLDSKPDFIELARTAIEIFHPEVLNFPDDIIELAVEFKAEKFRESYETMLRERSR